MGGQPGFFDVDERLKDLSANHARRLKTLRGLTPHEHVLQVWTKEPKPFRLDPSHHIPGPYT